MCGIAGIINQVPREFDYTTFCTLGIANDARGGDSCGIFIDGFYDYGVEKNKYFSDYFQESSYLYNLKESKIALVHCRKASVGAVSKETAQPVVIEEEGVVKFVVLHNGTIYNYKELASKYIPNIDITNMTDSQIMARIFYYSGYDALNEYIGGSVFVIVDYREETPKTLLFKGFSKKSEYSQIIEEERPLYYTIDSDKQELVFSSVGIYLVSLRKEGVVYSMEGNSLLEFNGTDLVCIKKYDREKCYQSKPSSIYPAVSSYKSSRTWGYNNWDYNNWGYNNCEEYSDFAVDDGIVGDAYVKCDAVNNTYSLDGKLLNGEIHMSKWGFIRKSVLKSLSVWFFDGVALQDASCYKFLISFRKSTGLPDFEFSKKYQTLIRYLSIDGLYTIDGAWYKAFSPTKSALYTGDFQQLTSSIMYHIISGFKKYTSYNNDLKTTDDFNKRELNFKAIREECGSMMK